MIDLKRRFSIFFILSVLIIFVQVEAFSQPQNRIKKNTCAEVSLAIKSQGVEEKVRGVVVDKDGYIMTSAKPVRTADQIIVYFNDGSVQFAEVYSANNIADVAMLKVEAVPRGACSIRLKKLEYLKSQTLVAGSNGDEVQITKISELYQEKSSIDNQTRIEYYLLSESDDYQVGTPMYDLGGSFAGFISDTLRIRNKVLVTAQIAKRKLMNAVSFWTGADMQLVGISHLNAGHETGFSIRKLSSKSALATEGIRPGDIIIDIDGATARNIDELETLYQRFKESNGIVTLHYLRDGRVREAEVDMN